MRSFTLHLMDATHGEDIEGVTSFVGADGSGSFGLMAGHERSIAVLEPGLCRFRQGGDNWRYLASPGAVLRFADNQLTFSSRLYILGDDAAEISGQLQQQLQAESEMHQAIEHLRSMEQDMLKRLWQLQRRQSGSQAYG